MLEETVIDLLNILLILSSQTNQRNQITMQNQMQFVQQKMG